MSLAFALAMATAIAYGVLWSFFGGLTGCGPPGHSTSGRLSVPRYLCFRYWQRSCSY